ncbi:MAG: hypothetical protein ACXWWL_07360 [Candidatus Limnocylindria bacterium]
MTLERDEPRPRTSGQVPHDSLVRVDRRVKEILARAERTGTPVAEIAPTITAILADGPLAGSSVEVELVEGRPPKTIDTPAEDGSTCRYCLADWVQSGRSASYTFLYLV